MPPIDAMIVPLIATLTGFAALWPVSVVRRDASLVDLAWGPGFSVQLVIAAALLGATDARDLVMIALVTVWSVRLGIQLGRRRWREGREDARYRSVRESWGTSFWWKSLFVVFVLQAVLQWLIVMPVIIALATNPVPFGPAALAGAIIAIAGLVLETRADLELDHFKRSAGSDRLLTTGLRAYVRHPNYLGEIVFWLGIAVIAAEGGAWLAFLSPALIFFLLTRISGVPLLDARLSETRPEYADYRARVPALIPALRSRGGHQ